MFTHTPPEPTPESPHSHLVLLIEDNADCSEALSMAFEAAGVTAVVAENGRQALDYLQSQARPCVILLDLMLPVMDGWEFRQHQLSEPAISSIPTMVYTGAGREEECGSTLSAAAYFTKPTSIPMLVDYVSRLCRFGNAQGGNLQAGGPSEGASDGSH